MKILLRNLSGEDILCIDVDPHCTLAELKLLIYESKVPMVIGRSISLILGETILQQDCGEKNLEDFGVTDGSSLVLTSQEFQVVLTSSFDKTAKLWTAATGECTQTFTGHNGMVFWAVFSAGGDTVLTRSSDDT